MIFFLSFFRFGGLGSLDEEKRRGEGEERKEDSAGGPSWIDSMILRVTRADSLCVSTAFRHELEKVKAGK